MEDTKLQKLLEQRKVLDARIREEQNKAAVAKRKAYTRRKILIGAFIDDKASKDDNYNNWLLNGLDGFLTRPDDRALFGFPPLAPADTAQADTAQAATNLSTLEDWIRTDKEPAIAGFENA